EIFANEEKKGIIDSAEEKYKRFKAFRSEGPLKSATAAVEKTVAEQSEAIDYTSEVARLNALLSQQLPKEVIADEIKKLNQNIRGLSKAQNISDADKKRLENELIEISNQLDFKFVNQK
ncbi:hypothetical protein HGA64_05280, partial [Candidatus Falkowbacteria bacterium]|nr:hypothetical protein [Candidatus Falkowbacteria bacterium]